MKKIEHTHRSWCVKNDGSQLFKDTVINYLNDNYINTNYSGNFENRYYGVDKGNNTWSSDTNKYFTKELTLDEFIKLTKEEMKYFKTNQTVYHPVYGKGEVYEIDESVRVKFEKVNSYFTLDGRINHTEPVVLSQNPIPEIVNKPLEDEYIPFTFEDDLLGKILICKNEKEKLIVSVQLKSGIYSGQSFITYSYLLDNYEFVDGKPCGKLAN